MGEEAGEGRGAAAEVRFLLRALVGVAAGAAEGVEALALRTWAAGLGGDFGVAAAVWAYVWEALAAAAAEAAAAAVGAMLRAEEATCWAWSA